MSYLHRIFGIEFGSNSVRYDRTHKDSGGKTGYELGSRLGYTEERRLSEQTLFTAMGIEFESEAALDLGDEVRFGKPEVLEFVEDFVTGYTHAANNRRAANDAVGKFHFAVKYLADKRIQMEAEFSEENLKAVFGETGDFLLTEESGTSSARHFFSQPFIVKGCKILIDEEHVFGIHPDVVYDEETCLIISRLFNSLAYTSYSLIERCMEEEHRQVVVNKIRLHVEQNFNGFHCASGEIPNFYM
ncbi:hypothetical protein AC3HA11_1080 [Escherichia phage vB_EcoM_3HA11]|nr:hypothetical protein AC3HA11_1080 [Escherichia phage vB_EcoM_3HA11]